MKKLVLSLLVLILILQVSAIETNLKSNYQPGETLIAEITGNFIDNIKAENILFYSDRLFIPLIYDIAKIQDKYYLYALLPEKERDYTLTIKNAHYYEAGQEITQDLQFNFSTKGNMSLFSVNPGFIITNQDFKIKVEARKSITLKSEFLNLSQETNIPIGQEKAISFSVSGIKKFTFTKLLLSSENTKYEIPIAIFKSEEEKNKITIEKGFRFSKPNLNITLLKDYETDSEITILNTGQEDIENIEFDITELKGIIKIKPKKIIKLEAGSQEKLNLTIKSEKEGIKEGKIIAFSENYTAELLIFITTTGNRTEFISNINNSDLTTGKSCSEEGGVICGENEECDETNLLTIEGYCCVGTCEEESEGGAGKIIAIILIVLILGIIGFFVYRKMRLRKATSKEILKRKEKVYEERFKPQEIKGGLTRI